MEALKENEIYGQELVEKITSFNVSEADLMKEFEISESTFRLYRKTNKGKTPTRKSLVQMKLYAFEKSLELIKKLGYKGKELDIFKSLHFEGESIFAFINEYASNPLAIKFIENFIEKELGHSFKKKGVDMFREIYGHLNDENLIKASADRPDLLIEMIGDTDLRPSTRGDILQALAFGSRDDFFNYIFSQLKSESPFIREAALLSLYDYYQSNEKYSFLKTEFLRILENEKAEGVLITLKDLLEEM